MIWNSRILCGSGGTFGNNHTHIHTHSGQIAIQVFHNESLFPLVLKTPSAIKIIEEKIRFYFVRANYACHELFSPCFRFRPTKTIPLSVAAPNILKTRYPLKQHSPLYLIVGDKILLRLNETLQKPKKKIKSKINFRSAQQVPLYTLYSEADFFTPRIVNQTTTKSLALDTITPPHILT